MREPSVQTEERPGRWPVGGRQHSSCSRACRPCLPRAVGAGRGPLGRSLRPFARNSRFHRCRAASCRYELL